MQALEETVESRKLKRIRRKRAMLITHGFDLETSIEDQKEVGKELRWKDRND